MICTSPAAAEFLHRRSFIELGARERARTLLDPGMFHELLPPFDNLSSPWLRQLGIVPQSDDGVVVAKGTIENRPAVLVATEGRFQGGSIGEISGTKMATALELARCDNERGIPRCAVLLLESGGVRLQEANLGLGLLAEIQASIIALRRYSPVIAVIAGMVGCFGGMAVTAALCSYIIVTPEARLGMNGPEIIEQEAGIEEFDASNRPLIWSISGGEQRYETGLADFLVEDDSDAIARMIRHALRLGPPDRYRSTDIDEYLKRLTGVEISGQIDPKVLRETWDNRSR